MAIPCLERAIEGDESAFRELVEPHRAQLHAHCYRLLGSVHDADDALQDTLLRAWRGLPRFRSGSTVGTWLFRIATNVCIDATTLRGARVLPIDYGPRTEAGADPGDPVDEPRWLEPYPTTRVAIDDEASPAARYDQREAVELAFVAALQHLPPRQRAVLILREVLGYSAAEVADMLDTTTASVNSALQRARRRIGERLPDRTQQETLRALGDERARELVERFTTAIRNGDVDAILTLLADDVRFSMPPYAAWSEGSAAVAHSWLMPDDPDSRLRFVATRANAQLAVACYKLDPEVPRYRPIGVDVLTLRGEVISEITVFRDLEVIRRLGLPEELRD